MTLYPKRDSLSRRADFLVEPNSHHPIRNLGCFEVILVQPIERPSGFGEYVEKAHIKKRDAIRRLF